MVTEDRLARNGRSRYSAGSIRNLDGKGKKTLTFESRFRGPDIFVSTDRDFVADSGLRSGVSVYLFDFYQPGQ